MWSAVHAVRSETWTAPSVRPPCLTASNDQGFVIDEAEVVYWGGLCPDCKADQPEIVNSHRSSRTSGPTGITSVITATITISRKE